MTQPEISTVSESKRTHDLATLAVSFAFVGVMLAMLGPWLVVPSLVCAYFANKAILREPEKYQGSFFIKASLVLNLITFLTFLAFFIGQA